MHVCERPIILFANQMTHFLDMHQCCIYPTYGMPAASINILVLDTFFSSVDDGIFLTPYTHLTIYYVSTLQVFLKFSFHQAKVKIFYE